MTIKVHNTTQNFMVGSFGQYPVRITASGEKKPGEADTVTIVCYSHLAVAQIVEALEKDNYQFDTFPG